MILTPNHEYKEPSRQLMDSCLYPGCGLPEFAVIHKRMGLMSSTATFVPLVESVGVLERLAIVSAKRAEKWHGDSSIENGSWTISDWTMAMCGEVGEASEAYLQLAMTSAAGHAADTAKKIRRVETGTRNDGDPELEVLKEKYLIELADVVIYAQLCAAKQGKDIGEYIVKKFNATSDKFGFEEKI